MRIYCEKFNSATDYENCIKCPHKVEAKDDWVSCYHAKDADNLKFNVAVFKDKVDNLPTFNKVDNLTTFKKVDSATTDNFEVYDKVILTEL